MRTKFRGWLNRLGFAPDEAARAAALRAIEARHAPVMRALDDEIARIEAAIESCELHAIAIIEAEHEIARKQLVRDACQAAARRKPTRRFLVDGGSGDD